jgi:hypothetical protein
LKYLFPGWCRFEYSSVAVLGVIYLVSHQT